MVVGWLDGFGLGLSWVELVLAKTQSMSGGFDWLEFD